MKSTATRSLFAAACVAAVSAAHASDFTDKSSLVLFAGGNAEMPGSFRGQTVPFDSVDPFGVPIGLMNERSIFKMSTGNWRRYASDE